MPASWRLRAGWEPIPGVGIGPFTDADFKARWKAYRERGGWSAQEAPLGGAVYEKADDSDIAAAEGTTASPDAAASSEYDGQE